MTLPITKRRSPKGFTLIEVLAVVAIIALLMAAAASPFVHALHSYKGQYESESQQLEATRAVAEFNYYGRKAVYHELVSDGTSKAVLFRDAAGNIVTFTYTQGGAFIITLRGMSYTYSDQWTTSTEGPFMITNGGVALFFQVQSAGAPVTFQTFVSSNPL